MQSGSCLKIYKMQIVMCPCSIADETTFIIHSYFIMHHCFPKPTVGLKQLAQNVYMLSPVNQCYVVYNCIYDYMLMVIQILISHCLLNFNWLELIVQEKAVSQLTKDKERLLKELEQKEETVVNLQCSKASNALCTEFETTDCCNVRTINRAGCPTSLNQGIALYHACFPANLCSQLKVYL